jgi:hypothetical protein
MEMELSAKTNVQYEMKETTRRKGRAAIAWARFKKYAPCRSNQGTVCGNCVNICLRLADWILRKYGNFMGACKRGLFK